MFAINLFYRTKLMKTLNKYTSKSLWLAVILLGSLLAGCNSSSSGPTGDVPTVTSTIPADSTTAVAINQKVIARFSTAMQDSSIDSTSFTVVGASEPAMVGTVSLDAASNTAIFEPNTPLSDNVVYTATITTAAKSSGGKTLASNYVWTFTSGTNNADSTAPTVVSTDPADTDTDVILNKTVAATFDEALDPSTVNATSFTLTADAGATVIAGTVSTSNRVVTFKPDSNLAINTLYTATLTTAVTDSVAPANALAANYVWSFTTGTAVATGPSAIYLGTAANFAIVAASAITSAGSTTITGDIALSPAAGSYITVACSEIVGEVYTVDAGYPNATCVNSNKTAAGIAVADMQTAYTAASAPATPAAVGSNLNIGGGTVTAQTLPPGTYTWGTNVTITGGLTLDGGTNDVWIFQIDGTLDTDQAIILAGTAQARNVFWRVADTVSLNPGAQFKGIVLAKTNIDMKDGATITGRLLAQTAATLGTTTVVTQP
jgi:hypothetical protein